MTGPYDVVVLGGGLAGAAAAAAAAEEHARVLLLEKRDRARRQLRTQRGTVRLRRHRRAARRRRARQRRPASPRSPRGRPAPRRRALVDRYCAEQAGTYRWLRSHGAVFGAPRAASGQSVPRSHPVDVAALIDELVRRARPWRSGALPQPGNPSRHERRARRRRRRRGSGRPAATVAAPTVVITTGGFVRNAKLLAEFAPAMERALKAGGDANTGDGLLMGLKVGAGLADTPHIKGTFGIFPWPSPAEGGHGLLAVYKGAIAVNGEGRRFVDESLPYKEIGDACLAQPEGIAFQIMDDAVLAESDAEVPIYDFRPRLDAGQVTRADSLAGLADALGIPGDPLAATVADYNLRIARGEPDAFGRADALGRRRYAASDPRTAVLRLPVHDGAARDLLRPDGRRERARDRRLR